MHRFLPVIVLCAALLAVPAFAAGKKPTPEELLSPAPVAAPADCTKAYDEILKVEATNLVALNGRGLCKNMTSAGSGDDDLNKAIELATTLIKADEKNAEAYYSRATTYRVLQDFKKAEADYARALELKPDNAFWAADLKTVARQAELQAQMNAQAAQAQKVLDPAEAALQP